MKLLVALLVAVGAAVGLAAYFVPSDAASVNGTAISRGSLNTDLAAIAGSTDYQCYLQAQLVLSGNTSTATGLFPVTGAGKVTKAGSPPTYNNNFVRFWLSKMADDVLVSQLLAQRHITVTQADVAFATSSFSRQVTSVLGALESETGQSCGVSAAQVLGSLPKSFVTQQIQAQAAQDVLSVHLAGFSLSTAALERYYDMHSSEFDTECISFASYTSKTDASSASSQIKGGTPIAKTGTVSQIGCGPELLVTDLPASVVTLPVGTLSQPVSEGTGTKYALLFVTARNPTPFGKVRTLVAQALLDSTTSKTTAVLTVAGAKADVTADPRYGRVRPLSVDLAAPVSPASVFVPDAVANLPPAQKIESAATATPSKGATSSTAAG